VRENWIKMKYSSKTFVKPFKPMKIEILKSSQIDNEDSSLRIVDINNEMSSNCEYIKSPNELLHLACAHGDLPLIYYALALNNTDRNSVINETQNNLDDKNEPLKVSLGYTPLIKAVYSDSLPAVELLLLNGAKINITDFNGRTPLHHATLTKNLKYFKNIF
jgi:ankyrin repeat protein